eukprot:6484069-Prymnesium_polylepis.1
MLSRDSKKLTTSDKVDAYSFDPPPIRIPPESQVCGTREKITVTSSGRRTIVSHRRLGGYQTTVWYHLTCVMLNIRSSGRHTCVKSIKESMRAPQDAHERITVTIRTEGDHRVTSSIGRPY